MNNLKMKATILSALVCLTAIPGTLFAQTNKTSTVNVNISATMIDVTVPLTVACNINPNTAFANAFTSAKLPIVNNTNSPVKIRANTLTAQGTSIKIVNKEAHTDEEWNNLLNPECLTNIALGLKASDVTNLLGATFDEQWFKTSGGSTVTGFDVGIIKPLKQIELEVVAKHGMVFKESKDNSYALEYIATLE